MTTTALKSLSAAAGVILLAATVGCEAKKSSNPLSPSVAGPIPGVNITAPAVVEPSQGFKFRYTEQPIRLTVQNAATSGVRPLSYAFEVATDSGFETKVFSKGSVPPGDGGRTSVQLDVLEIGRAYYWRVRALDGANTGPYTTASFEIFPKPVLNPPTAVSPVNAQVTSSTTPTLTVHNAAFVGPVGDRHYDFQVSADQAFVAIVATATVAEGGGDTSYTTAPLPSSRTYFWRARASDGETTSDWTPTQTFKTPSVATPPPPPPGGGGGGSCALGNGPQIVACISAKYADRRVPVGSLSERQANMMFLRDRIIEAGKCSGLDYGWNLKRGGPEKSIDVIAWKRPDGNMGVDIAFDYDNIGTTLQLGWSEIDLFASYSPYPAVSCGGV
jgi:hypothetical protein